MWPVLTPLFHVGFEASLPLTGGIGKYKEMTRLSSNWCFSSDFSIPHTVKVAVVAAPDPERMMGDTVAWRGRLMQQSGEEEFRLHRPLYHLNTYTDSQVSLTCHCPLLSALKSTHVNLPFPPLHSLQ